MLRPQYKRANDPRQPVCPASESHAPSHTVRQQQCLDRRARMSHPTERIVHVVLCNAAVVSRSHSCIRVCCWCSPQRVRQPALSSISQTSLANCCVFVFRSPLMNHHQRLQPLNLSLHCPPSLCNAVYGQHSPRKPCCGAGRLATTPDTKTICAT